MMIVETSSIDTSLLPTAELALLLRLPSGFADDDDVTEQLESCLSASVATIEARTGKAIVRRGFSWTIHHWHGRDAQVLPVAPVRGITELRVVAGNGDVTLVDPGRYDLRADTHRPAIVARAGGLPVLGQSGSRAEIDFEAGYGAIWEDVPGDLQQAVLALAAQFFDRPSQVDRVGTASDLPARIGLLIEPYRGLGLRGVQG